MYTQAKENLQKHSTTKQVGDVKIGYQYALALNAAAVEK
jgi:hypothetical protein